MTTFTIAQTIKQIAMIASLGLPVGAAAQEHRSAPVNVPLTKAGASIALAMTPGRPLSPTWCYDKEPAFVYSLNRSLMWADLKGNVRHLFEAPEYISGVFCSEDGGTISLLSRPDNRKAAIRLSILDVPSNESGQYLIDLHQSTMLDFTKRAPMSLDGRIFALPSDPKLVAGRDLLKDRRIIHTDSPEIFWTKDFMFLGEQQRARYRVHRIPDLGDLGTIDLPADRVLNEIVECQGAFLAYYYVDAADHNVVETIADRRLGSTGTIRSDNPGGISQEGDICVITLLRRVQGQDLTAGVRVLRHLSQTEVDLRSYDRLFPRISGSKDGRFLLAAQPLGRVGSITGSKIIVLRVNRGRANPR